jgi:hypothetical protein
MNRNANCICRKGLSVAEIDPTPLLPIVVLPVFETVDDLRC